MVPMTQMDVRACEDRCVAGAPWLPQAEAAWWLVSGVRVRRSSNVKAEQQKECER
jgi:hypothetical protein